MSEPDDDSFSYAEPDDPRLKRFVIKLVERMSGQPYLRYLYEDHLANPLPGESFWDAAVRRLELRVVYNEQTLSHWPKTGPLIVVSNHPFGVLDGVVICHLVSRVREDFRSGARGGVNGTPTFFINGERYDGDLNLDELLDSLLD